MAYQVLARKWRPRTFSEMVGQQHVLRALMHALDSGRIHHAFLFTGTRGVGKTTIARILAKSLNCEQGVSSQPCCTCSACCEIDEGRFVDLIEVDAASRTKVEETRELLENVQYMPTFGRYKVYLIDEVHMFSKSSFNAILKTLEEPPPHVKFLLATTDPQKLPVTILSRCLQFNLRSLSLPLIRDQLARILEAEEIPFEEAALRELARGADGSMRDGLSLLDQAIAYGGGKVMAEDVHAMLGTLARNVVYPLMEGIAAGDATTLMAVVENLAHHVPDWNALLGEIVGLLQRIALAQFVPEAIDDYLGDRERILALAKRMTLEDVQLHYQIGLIGRRDLALAPEPRGGFEMVLLRMLAFRPLPEENVLPSASVSAHAPTPGSANAPRTAALRVVATTPTPPPARMAVSPSAVPSSQPFAGTSTSAMGGATSTAAPSVNADPVFSLATLDWSKLVGTLGLVAANRELAMHCSLQCVEGTTLHLALDKTKFFLLTKDRARYVEEAVQRQLGATVRVVIAAAQDAPATVLPPPVAPTPAVLQEIRQQERAAAARRSIERDPGVRALREILDAELDLASIRPRDG